MWCQSPSVLIGKDFAKALIIMHHFYHLNWCCHDYFSRYSWHFCCYHHFALRDVRRHYRLFHPWKTTRCIPASLDGHVDTFALWSYIWNKWIMRHIGTLHWISTNIFGSKLQFIIRPAPSYPVVCYTKHQGAISDNRWKTQHISIPKLDL